VTDVVVDASVWVSRLVAGHVHHARCREWMDKQASSGGILVAPALVLAEVAGAISRRTKRPSLARRAVEALQALPNLRLVSMDPALAGLAAELAADHALRGADAVYVATASQLGLPLVTLDGEQLQRAKPIVSTSSP
jgi:predicted nucleic acid-binding protein